MERYYEDCGHKISECNPIACGFGCKIMVDEEGRFTGQLCSDPSEQAMEEIGILEDKWGNMSPGDQEVFDNDFWKFKYFEVYGEMKH